MSGLPFCSRCSGSSAVSFAPEGETLDAPPNGADGVTETATSRGEGLDPPPPSPGVIASKPPSIRRILKERATQLFQLPVASGASTKTGSDPPRQSRADQFTAHGRKPVKSRGLSAIRKLLGIRKEAMAETQSTAASSDSLHAQQSPHGVPVAVKVRPEILHPIDFHTGSVQVNDQRSFSKIPRHFSSNSQIEQKYHS